MSVEVTIICDLCGTIGDAQKTASEARAVVQKELRWQRLRIDDKLLDVCPKCVSDHGGTNAIRQFVRKPAAPASQPAPVQPEGSGR